MHLNIAVPIEPLWLCPELKQIGVCWFGPIFEIYADPPNESFTKKLAYGSYLTPSFDLFSFSSLASENLGTAWVDCVPVLHRFSISDQEEL